MAATIRGHHLTDAQWSPQEKGPTRSTWLPCGRMSRWRPLPVLSCVSYFHRWHISSNLSGRCSATK